MSDVTIGETLHRLLHAYKRALRQAYQEGDVPLAVSHIRTLKCVHAIPGCTAQAIVGRTHIDKAQITRALNDLLAQGLIEKRDHPEDRRSYLIALTPSGRAMVRRIRALERRAGARMAQGFRQDELAEFVRLANLMMTNLTE